MIKKFYGDWWLMLVIYYFNKFMFILDIKLSYLLLCEFVIKNIIVFIIG